MSFSYFVSSFAFHPIYVSVTEIEHNAKENILQVSCKIFSDDFEKTLSKTYNIHVDLSQTKYKPAMDKIIDDYIQKHLKIAFNSRLVSLKYFGYEQIEEAVFCYFQVDNVNNVKTISVTDNILYEYKDNQISLLHITINGNRKSIELNNPQDKIEMKF